MASRNIKLPVVEPFELPDPPASSNTDGLADELEAALNTDLQVLASTLGGAEPADEASTDSVPPSERRPADSMTWDSQDPRAQRVVRRLDQARRPKAKGDAPPLSARLADAHTRGTSRFDTITSPRVQSLAKPSQLAAPPQTEQLTGGVPARPSAKRAVEAKRTPRQAPVTTSIAFDEEPFPDALQSVLRGRSMEEDLLAEAEARDRLRQRPRLGTLAIAAILFAGAGAGATIAFQLLAPRDPQATARAIDPAPAEVLATAASTGAVATIQPAAATTAAAPVAQPVERQQAPSSQTSAVTTRAVIPGAADTKTAGTVQGLSSAARDVPVSDGKPIKTAEPPARGPAAVPPAVRTETAAAPAPQQSPAGPAVKPAGDVPVSAAPRSNTAAASPPAPTPAPTVADTARALPLARPRPADPPAAAPPAWLVEDDPATFEATARAQANSNLAAAAPSWFVEDDPATFATAKAGAPARQADAAVAPPRTSTGAAPPSVNLDRMVITGDVTVRTAPDNQSSVVGVLKTGTVVAVGECKLWCEVTLAGKSGWVFHTFLADPSVVATAH